MLNQHAISAISGSEGPSTFRDNEAAEAWFTSPRCPRGVCCLYRGSGNVQVGCQHKTQTSLHLGMLRWAASLRK